MTDTPQSLPITIRHRFTDQVLFTASPKAKSVKEALIEAVQAGAYLADANLARVNLADANLAGANLAGAYLARVNLADVNLADANLAGANLAGAYLADANLAGANLADANLAGAYLADANLAGANLAGAYLAGANLARAYLADANLARVNLAGANLAGAKGSDLVVAMTRILPDGALIGWKKCRDNVLVKLRIPENAKRSSAFGRKCRAEYAEVVEIIGAVETDSDGRKIARSHKDADFTYREGVTVYPIHGFCDDWSNECAGGIHFFITKKEAEVYEY